MPAIAEYLKDFTTDPIIIAPDKGALGFAEEISNVEQLLASSICVSSTKAMLSQSNLGVQQVSLLSRTAWLTVQHSTRLSKQVAIPPFVLVRHRMPTLSSFQRKMLTRQWTALLASVAALVLQLARMVQQCSSCHQRCHSLLSFHRAA